VVDGVNNLGGKMETLSSRLGVSESSLVRMLTGWNGKAYTFPMFDGQGNMCGVRLRSVEGKKWSVKGSRNGIFWPLDVSQFNSTPLFVCEGPTDTAAVLDLGFDAIGRPNALGGRQYIVEWLSVSRRDIICVVDRDYPSMRGALDLAQAARQYTVSFSLLAPPPGYKDIRAWANGGATQQDLWDALKNELGQ
jgi:hypothetical protein